MKTANSEGWNIFDFVVVAIGILSVLKVPGAAKMGMHTHTVAVSQDSDGVPKMPEFSYRWIY